MIDFLVVFNKSSSKKAMMEDFSLKSISKIGKRSECFNNQRNMEGVVYILNPLVPDIH